MSSNFTCDWCGRKLENSDPGFIATVDCLEEFVPDVLWSICRPCSLIAIDALQLAKEIAQTIQKGGKQLYIAIERTGQKTELLSVKRWSPLEQLESAENAERPLSTYPLAQE